jgi:hypothetical protein
MHKELRPEQVDILAASPAVNDEFSKKIKELDRRLQMNGMNYREWDTLNDRQPADAQTQRKNYTITPRFSWGK